MEHMEEVKIEGMDQDTEGDKMLIFGAIETNFDDFIPEVYTIKNSNKGNLLCTKTETDYYSSDFSSDRTPPKQIKRRKVKSKTRGHTSRRSVDKPFKCNFCSFVTAWKCNIIRHRLQHTREKVFGCHLCDYTALQKSNLRTHIRIHMGEKRFNCGVCEYKTMYRSTLDVHVAKHKRAKQNGETVVLVTPTSKKHFKDDVGDDEIDVKDNLLDLKMENHYVSDNEKDLELKSLPIRTIEKEIIKDELVMLGKTVEINGKTFDELEVKTTGEELDVKPIPEELNNKTIPLKETTEGEFSVIINEEEFDVKMTEENTYVKIIELKPSEINL